jgi:hypothetical protein
MKFRPFLIAGLALIILFSMFSVTLSFDWNFLWKPKPDQKKIAAGLKEALQIGTDNSVQLTGRLDGFYKNPQIKIPLPVQFQKIEKVLRQFGLEEQVDEFILSLNRAAEKAAPAARDIFWKAIQAMTFDDVIAVFKGSDTAATDYFKAKTSEELITAFTPVVSRATEEAEVTKLYKQLTHEIKKIKFLNLEPVDIDRYVVTKTLDGLFHVLGEEEKKIRKDPAARVTELLKDVFAD